MFWQRKRNKEDGRRRSRPVRAPRGGADRLRVRNQEELPQEGDEGPPGPKSRSRGGGAVSGTNNAFFFFLVCFQLTADRSPARLPALFGGGGGGGMLVFPLACRPCLVAALFVRDCLVFPFEFNSRPIKGVCVCESGGCDFLANRFEAVG